MDEEEFPSDSEHSDEDYCPDEQQTENLSEIDSDDQIDDGETHANDSGKKKSSKKRKKGNISTTKQMKDEDIENVEAEASEDVEDDKSRADALWADFLSGTDPLPTKKKPESSKTVPTVEETPIPDNVQPEPKKETPTKLVTQIFDFAGEKVEITKEIKETTPSTTIEKSDGKTSGIGRRPPFSGLKRTGGGIGSVLGQLAKKNKISVLDKSKHDWDSFKRNEGIDEQLQTHNKGRDGYLERQDFLDRTDVRQFELEKSIRLSKRNNRNY